MRHSRGLAGFACGAEALHAVVHTYFWRSGTTLDVLGFRETPKWHRNAAIGHALVSLALAFYVWGDLRPRPVGSGRSDAEPANALPSAGPSPRDSKEKVGP